IVSIDPVLIGWSMGRCWADSGVSVTESLAEVMGVVGYSSGSGTVNCYCARVSASWLRAPVMRRLTSLNRFEKTLRVLGFSATFTTLRQDVAKLADPNGALAAVLLL